VWLKRECLLYNDETLIQTAVPPKKETVCISIPKINYYGWFWTCVCPMQANISHRNPWGPQLSPHPNVPRIHGNMVVPRRPVGMKPCGPEFLVIHKQVFPESHSFQQILFVIFFFFFGSTGVCLSHAPNPFCYFWNRSSIAEWSYCLHFPSSWDDQCTPLHPAFLVEMGSQELFIQANLGPQSSLCPPPK
jgi:hypothetical protein